MWTLLSGMTLMSAFLKFRGCRPNIFGLEWECSLPGFLFPSVSAGFTVNLTVFNLPHNHNVCPAHHRLW